MIDQVSRVAELRNILETQKAEKERLMAAWVENHKGLLNAIANIGFFLDEAESALRASAIEEYRATGNKAPTSGVGIRIMTRLSYDPKEANDWAIEHKIALKLDVNAFEKLAKASPLAFVTITEEPQATIATDLTKVLADTLPAQG